MKTASKCRIGGINGPYRVRPSGKFRRNGKPIMARCKLFFVVDFMDGTVRKSREFRSRELAGAFLATLMPCDLV